jgi:hypothetical protein
LIGQDRRWTAGTPSQAGDALHWSLRLLERLSKRNEFLIASHHPLRETLMKQTGASEIERRQFLNAMHMEAMGVLVHEWEPVEVAEPLF